MTQTSLPTKRPFESPELVVFGSIQEMTLLKCPTVTHSNEPVNINDNNNPGVCDAPGQGQGRKKT